MYSASAISEVFNISVASIYYQRQSPKDESYIEEQLKNAFTKSYGSYGRRRLKLELRSSKYNITLSERKVSKIMKKLDLQSKYIKYRKKKPAGQNKVNESKNANLLNRQFNDFAKNEIILSDLIYIKINRWCYLCAILELSRREVIGYAIGPQKDEDLVKKALYSIKFDLRKISIFHTDRGSEFSGHEVAKILNAMGILHSLSAKGTPCDNSPMEAFYKTLRTEFTNDYHFNNLSEFSVEFAKWVTWYNTERLHSSLNYEPPIKDV